MLTRAVASAYTWHIELSVNMKTGLEIVCEGLAERKTPVVLLTENAGAVAREEILAICRQYGPEGLFARAEAYL